MKVQYNEAVAESCLRSVENYRHLAGFGEVYDAIRKEMEECQAMLREADYVSQKLAQRIDNIESERARLTSKINNSEEPSESDKSALNSLPSTGEMRNALARLQSERGNFLSYVQNLSGLYSQVKAVEEKAKSESDPIKEQIKRAIKIMDDYFATRVY